MSRRASTTAARSPHRYSPSSCRRRCGYCKCRTMRRSNRSRRPRRRGRVLERPMDVLQRLAAEGAVIERLSADSRRCAPGTAFFAYPGEKADGRAYIDDALARGASAVLWEAERFAWSPAWRVPHVALPGLKQQAGMLAARFFGEPSPALWLVGVPGPNGKTYASHWIASAPVAIGVHHRGIRP